MYVRNRPTGLVDPDGRAGVVPDVLTPVAQLTAAATDKSRAKSGEGGKSSGSAKSEPGVGDAIGSFFDTIATGLAKIADFVGEWLPGLIAGPLAGVVDILGGFSRVLGGVFSGSGETVLKGLKEMGLGALRIIGLKEVVGDTWVKRKDGPDVPKTFADDIAYTHKNKAEDSWRNGHKSWHAATNAIIAQRVGPNPIALAGLSLAGVIHETPIDWDSFKEEQRNQGTVNHIIDSLIDIVANTIGMVIGLLLPRKPAVAVAAFVGRWLLPGPGDRDRKAGGTGGTYEDSPADAWWKWKYDTP